MGSIAEKIDPVLQPLGMLAFIGYMFSLHLHFWELVSFKQASKSVTHPMEALRNNAEGVLLED